jgi:mersacidin/lichenicidin family type 2 lantibiotic
MTQSDIVAAWRDPALRAALSPDEAALLPPHPSGEIGQLPTTPLNSEVRLDEMFFDDIFWALGSCAPATSDTACCTTNNESCSFI